MTAFLAILLICAAFALFRQRQESDAAQTKLRQEAAALRDAEAPLKRRAETLLIELTATRARAQELTLELVAARGQGQALSAELAATKARLESIAHLGTIEDALAYAAGLRRVAEQELDNAKRLHREAELQTDTMAAHSEDDKARLLANTEGKVPGDCNEKRTAATLAPGETSGPRTKRH